MYLSLNRSVRISIGFCLLAAWFGAACGWQTLGMVLGASAIHEAGHYAPLRLMGASVTQLRVCVLGAVMEFDGRELSYAGELAAILAGPAANLLSAAVLLTADQGWQAAAGAHLVLGAFNLLPIRPLDGGRALQLLGTWMLGPSAGEQIARWISAAAAALAAAGCVYLMWLTRGSLWLLPAAAAALGVMWRECFGKTLFL